MQHGSVDFDVKRRLPELTHFSLSPFPSLFPRLLLLLLLIHALVSHSLSLRFSLPPSSSAVVEQSRFKPR